MRWSGIYALIWTAGCIAINMVIWTSYLGQLTSDEAHDVLHMRSQETLPQLPPIQQLVTVTSAPKIPAVTPPARHKISPRANSFVSPRMSATAGPSPTQMSRLQEQL